MVKRMLAFLCALTLLMGLAVAPVGAANLGGENENYQVGYSKKDITPWIDYTVGDKTLGIADSEYSDAAEHIATTTVHKYDGTKFTGETEQRQIVSISMGGHGDSLHRIATCLTDDNGDGFIGYGDGIFITCTSVTDDAGNTVMYFTVDTTGADATMTTEIREKVVAALGRNVISENQIMITANHSHAGPAFGNHRKAAAGTAWRAYYDYVVQQMIDAAKEAFNNKSVATMSKGGIKASSSMRSLDNSNPSNADADYSYRLNSIRHYNVTSDMYKSHAYKDGSGNIVESGWKNCNLYPECSTHLVGTGLKTIFSSHGGKTFREQPYNHMDADGNLLGTTTGYTSVVDYYLKRNAVEYVDVYKNMENEVFESAVADADETLYVLQFEREGAEPVVLINWRAHSTMNGNGNWRNLSSDFANSLRYRLENNKTLFGGKTDYCVAFWQGAGGNIVAGGRVEHNWKNPEFMPETEAAVKTPFATVTKDEKGNITAVECPEDPFYDTYYSSFQVALYDNDFYYTNKYGYLLGEVALDCLDSEMVTCAVGSIATKQVSMQLERQQFSEGLLAAAKHWQTLGGSSNTNLSYPFRYTWTDGKVYILNSAKHATEVAGRIGKTNTMLNLELNVITIGSDVAMVTVPNEPFDHYSDEYMAAFEVANADGKITDAEWEELIRIGQTDNDWYDLGEFSYGMPFVLGYTNSAMGYLPNAWSYDYNTHYEGDTYYGIYGPGCYESNTADMERGSGEAVVAKLKEMLETVGQNVKTGYCEACDETVKWEPRYADQLQVSMTGGHYYLAEDMTKHEEDTFRFNIGPAQDDSALERQSPTTVCLDLNGKKLGVNTNAFRVKLKSTFNIMDSVGGAEIVSTSGVTNEVAAGMIYLRGTGTLNLYGGTLRAMRKENADPNYGITSGAVIGGGGRFNMYGGTVIGGELIASANGTGGGAAIYITKSSSSYGEVNVYGGSILSGKAAVGDPGDCVKVAANTPVKLSGNAHVDDIFFAANTQSLTVSDFKGSANITYADGVTVQNGTNIGAFAGTTAFENGAITCGNYNVIADAGSLWLFDSNVKASLNGEPYDTLGEAVSNYADGDIIKLLADTEETVTIPAGKTVYMDLNGNDVANVSATGTLYCLDSQTDDYAVDAVNKTGYGKIYVSSGNVLGATIGDYVNADYLMVDDGEDGVSFHRVVLNITDMTLRPREENAETFDPSLYYKCDFLGDEFVAQSIETFGVALSVAGVPEEVGLSKCGYSTLNNFLPGIDGNAGRSTLLLGIMKESNAYLINKRNAEITVYGQAYVKLKNSGTYIYGEAQNRSFKQQIEKMDTTAVWNGLSTTSKDSAAALHAIYERVMRNWKIPNIKAHTDS